MATQRHIIALRRKPRRAVPKDWLELVRATSGVDIIGASETRAQIEAEDTSVVELRNKLGDDFIIETAISHERS